MLPLLIDAYTLAPILERESSGNLLLVDVCKTERFESKHIPGAKLVTPAQTQAGPPIPGLLPSPEALKELMQGIGLTPDSHVVVYDDEGGGWAGRFIWMLDEIGHKHYSYLDGGILAWEAEQKPLESGTASTERSDIEIKINGEHTVTLEQIVNRLNDDNLVVWDARSPGEHSGEKKNAARAGRIPGAINYEWTDAMDKANHLKLKPLSVLREELTSRGIDLSKQIVTHCQTHHRSGLTYLIGKILGATDIKAYAGSWGEWGNREDTPIESSL